MIDKIYLEALNNFGADTIEHSTRTLSDHLIGTHNLLESWNAPRETCLGGLFHSIYGTKYFKNQAVQLHERKKVQKIIGLDAELLVYLFCVTDRREFFTNIGCSPCVLYDVRHNTEWSGSPKILDQLLTIELANWLEMFPYIRHHLSSTSIHRTLEMFELSIDSFPSKAVKKLSQLKNTNFHHQECLPYDILIQDKAKEMRLNNPPKEGTSE